MKFLVVLALAKFLGKSQLGFGEINGMKDEMGIHAVGSMVFSLTQ